MLEIFFLGLAIAVISLIIWAPSTKNRGHVNPKGQKLAEAQTSIVFLTDDESRAVEYEHRFSASRTGMMLSRSGYRVRKRR
jgi:hypothetical protein